MNTRIRRYERIEDDIVAWVQPTSSPAEGRTIARLPTHATPETRDLLDQMLQRANTNVGADEAGCSGQAAEGTIVLDHSTLRRIYNTVEEATNRLEGEHDDANIIEASAALGRIEMTLQKLACESSVDLEGGGDLPCQDDDTVYAADVRGALLDAIDDGYVDPQAMVMVLAELDIGSHGASFDTGRGTVANIGYSCLTIWGSGNNEGGIRIPLQKIEGIKLIGLAGRHDTVLITPSSGYESHKLQILPFTKPEDAAAFAKELTNYVKSNRRS